MGGVNSAAQSEVYGSSSAVGKREKDINNEERRTFGRTRNRRIREKEKRKKF